MTSQKQPEAQSYQNVRDREAYPHVSSDEIDLLELWRIAWKGRWVISGITGAFAAISVIIALLLPDHFKSVAVLAPVAAEEKGFLAGATGQLGGLASLAGINLEMGQVDKTTLAIEVLKSRAFLTDFIKRHELVVPLMAATRFDLNAQQWVIDDDLYNAETKQWVRDVDPPQKPEPSDWEIYERFLKEVLTVEQDRETGIIRLGVELMSPYAAKQWASWLVEDLNNHIRKTDISEARKSIEYLEEQLGRTSVAGMQQVLYSLVEQQTQKMVLAQVRDEYVFKVIDPPVISEEKSKPNRIVICILMTFLGGSIALAIVFIREAASRNTEYRV